MPAQTTNEMINGVDVTQFTEVVKAVEADPSLGTCHFRARNKWQDGAHNQVQIQGFFAAGAEDTSREKPFVHDNDEPPLLVGNNKGANPVEYVLTALSGCLTTTLVYNASLMGIELDSVESTLEGDLDIRGLFNLGDNVQPGYQNIRVTFHIESDAPREKLEELVKLAKRFSPVCDTVSRPVSVDVELAA